VFSVDAGFARGSPARRDNSSDGLVSNAPRAPALGNALERLGWTAPPSRIPSAKGYPAGHERMGSKDDEDFAEVVLRLDPREVLSYADVLSIRRCTAVLRSWVAILLRKTVISSTLVPSKGSAFSGAGSAASAVKPEDGNQPRESVLSVWDSVIASCPWLLPAGWIPLVIDGLSTEP